MQVRVLTIYTFSERRRILEEGHLEHATKSTAGARWGSAETMAVGGDGSVAQSDHVRQMEGSRGFPPICRKRTQRGQPQAMEWNHGIHGFHGFRILHPRRPRNGIGTEANEDNEGEIRASGPVTIRSRNRASGGCGGDPVRSRSAGPRWRRFSSSRPSWAFFPWAAW